MTTYLLEIQPEEITFIYERKKQSLCSVRLINNSHKHVAYKIKTTAPKKYCVRPNVGMIMPKSTCDFTVIMQAQGSAPRELVCKDKFLVQSTIVSGHTTNEDVTRDMFVKGGDKYIEERKLRVSFITPPHSPISSPMNGKLKQGYAYEASILKDQILATVEIVTPEEKIAKNGLAKDAIYISAKSGELPTTKDAGSIPIKNAELSPTKESKVIPAKEEGFTLTTENAESSPTKVAKLNQTMNEGYTITKNPESSPTKAAKANQTKEEGYTITKNPESSPTKAAKFNQTKDEGFALTKNAELTPIKGAQITTAQDAQLRPVKDADLVFVNNAEKLELAKDIEDLKSKLIELESKLSEAEASISKLTEENRSSKQDSQTLRKDLEWRTKRGVAKVKEGYPLLLVCMVALLCIMLGYRLQSGI